MRVLLTGGTGFLGRRVLPLLQQHEVLCVSREPARLPRRRGVEVLAADLGSDGDWMRVIAKFRPELCLHLAWEGLPDYSLERCRVNLDAGIRLLGAAGQSSLQRMVVAGTCWEYGRASGPVTEDLAPTGVDVFAATKDALLTVLDSVARSSVFEYRWARIFFVYGPGQRSSSLIPSLRAAYTSGRTPHIRTPETLQDFVHVEDVAAALVALTEAETPSGVFNVGTGRPTSVAHVANAASEHYGVPRPFECVPGADGFWADTQKMYASTGWRARIGIDGA